MSLIRVCDCRCHDLDNAPQPIDESSEWGTFADRDVCWFCLAGCRHWQPYVDREPSEFEKQIRSIYGPAILATLSAQPLFKRLSADS